MRFLFSTILALVMTASLQAVTVAWTVPNSDWNLWNWTGKGEDGIPSISVHVLFSTTDYTADNQSLAAVAAAAAKGDGTVATYSGATSSGVSNTLQVYASNLNKDYKPGYYYMVVFDTTDKTNATYAIAMTERVDFQTTDYNSQGIYVTTAGGVPQVGDYVELGWQSGSTWFAPTAPEPTALALLALGVASLALRRKIS